MLPDALQIALKEWRVVCDALSDGRQIMMLRKGGVYESGGEFEVAHRQFLLFPTYVHQNPAMLKSQDLFAPASHEPESVEILVAGEITDIIPMPSRAVMDTLDDLHVWSSSLIDMRFNYRPENPLYLLLVRAYHVDIPIELRNTPEYAGCKSWVPLESAVPMQGALPALKDEEYESRRSLILSRIS